MTPHRQSDPTGFHGQVQGTTLPDLLQLQCLSMATRVVRVDANSVTGRIYFAGGQIVHAAVGVMEGEPALFEILRWPNGRFTFEEGTAPDQTIARYWQSILLEAAQLLDESTPNLAVQYPTVVPLTHSPMNQNIDELRANPEVLAYTYANHEGDVLDGKGEDAETLQAGFAYVLQLFQLVGSGLGADGLKEAHLQGKAGKAFCLLLDEGSLCGTTTPKGNLNAITQKFL